MKNIAVVFPGQASQYVGMGKDLYDANEDVRKLYAIASEQIGEDIAEIAFSGPAYISLHERTMAGITPLRAFVIASLL